MRILGSTEDLTAASSTSTASPVERQIKLRDKLRKFFVRRPTMESLKRKGIWKDEPVFGCHLQNLCAGDDTLVPKFVQRVVQLIESKPDNMKADGIYRASGNLSQVQKIRCQVDQNNWKVLEEEEDVHVLTGCLKLFFRELKEPLIPFATFEKALEITNSPSGADKIRKFKGWSLRTSSLSVPEMLIGLIYILLCRFNGKSVERKLRDTQVLVEAFTQYHQVS